MGSEKSWISFHCIKSSWFSRDFTGRHLNQTIESISQGIQEAIDNRELAIAVNKINTLLSESIPVVVKSDGLCLPYSSFQVTIGQG